MSWSNTELLSSQLSQIFKTQIKAVYPQLTEQELRNVLEITHSKQTHLGHYQCNSALKLTKLVNDNPKNIAAKILVPPSDLIESCQVAGPGFINITIKKSYLENALQKIL